jgi:hypothetical protein
VSSDAYRQIIAASSRDRRDLFLATAQRLGTPLGNIEKDFWVCWTLGELYHDLPPGAPRLLFKGGTSLSKAYDLIQRFSEDIDITVFRDDLDQPASMNELEAFSGKKRRAKLDAIRDSCRAYITGPLRETLRDRVAKITYGESDNKDKSRVRVEVDPADSDGQTLLIWYPTVEPAVDGMTDAYIRPVVRIESGAKSAIDPHRLTSIAPYIAEDVPNLDLIVTGVTTLAPARTFWDKIVIAHGLRRWYERRGMLRQEGQRISRHYYDLHCLLHSDVGRSAVNDRALGTDCVRHARLFFDRPDYDLASARHGSFALRPVAGMIDALRRDYDQMSAMIFGIAPVFVDVMDSMRNLEARING